MSDDRAPSEGAPRRSFLIGMGALLAGALASLPPLIAGVVALFDPLRRTGSDAGMVRVTRLSALPADGLPRRFTIRSDRVDAWTTYTDTPVGAVYLRRTEEDGVTALNVVCPHAGCFVNLAPDRARFACPCHRSSFALDGSINDPASPSPRDMDELEVEIRDGEVWVRFQNFIPGREDKLPVA
ncbi:MAG: Rieske (2Fe-2S) protein [Gemmatimonadetes bacterium]|nr:Rieske (2Fe-2S) protein [Gemmatimonadota bacterium]